MLLIYQNPEGWQTLPENERSRVHEEAVAIVNELTESGELVGGEALADPSQTVSVRPREGVPAVTDGPLAEAKEHFGGYLIVEVESPERATEIAVRWPNSRFGAMEVRPLMGTSGTEM
jgi:hypothetical protein